MNEPTKEQVIAALAAKYADDLAFDGFKLGRSLGAMYAGLTAEGVPHEDAVDVVVAATRAILDKRED